MKMMETFLSLVDVPAVRMGLVALKCIEDDDIEDEVDPTSWRLEDTAEEVLSESDEEFED
eukprot:CAMPEP_0196599462 /NCGR_PEP_ID=MMETSP1081-20130531/94869_1 /TAXON_ID=36882 /ORGANISM="Pyramimonas amylifera, Strain CCMP720" /LENGTH=59 /DNA_ID=CAMNT_0041925233 /DNA_START=841 /DNA_END=1020 /DNA_ORIENTATION=-